MSTKAAQQETSSETHPRWERVCEKLAALADETNKSNLRDEVKRDFK